MLTIRNDQMRAMAEGNPGQQVVLPCDLDFIEVDLIDQDGNPVAGVKYRVQAPDQSIHEGQTDADGKARIERIISGECVVTFPAIDRREWWPA